MHEMMARAFIIIDLNEALAGLMPTVIVPIVADSADLAANGKAFMADLDSTPILFAPNLVDGAGRTSDTFPCSSAKYRPL
jgi:hypothetical protein